MIGRKIALKYAMLIMMGSKKELNLYNQPSFSSSKSKSKVSLMDLKNVVTGPLGTSSKDPTVIPSI